MGNQCKTIPNFEKQVKHVEIGTERTYRRSQIKEFTTQLHTQFQIQMNIINNDYNKEQKSHLSETKCSKDASYEKEVRRISTFDTLKYLTHIKTITNDITPIQDITDDCNNYTFPNGIYRGILIDFDRNGKGEFFYHDGSYYVGEWKDDMVNGLGKLVFQDGDVYEGQFYKDCQHGYGTYTTTYMKYVGYWRYNQPHGKGAEEVFGYYKYEGEFKEGKKHGKGRIVWEEDGAEYIGQFNQNMMHGYGEYYFCEGYKYKGAFKNNKQNGYGEMEWPDGRKYIGNFVQGKKHGYGILSSGNTIYEGQWENGFQQGAGHLTIGNKRVGGTWFKGHLIKQ